MNICVYGASSRAIDKKYTDAAYEVGRILALRGHTLVFGGGNSGVMGASARGADSVEGTRILGIAPTFFNVDGVLYPHCTEFISPPDMRERKRLLAFRSDAFIVAPGGIGTYDEFFEILTLKQLGRHNKPIAVLNVNGYYDPLIALLRHTVEGEFMNETSMLLFKVFDTIEPMFGYLETYNEPLHELSFFKKIGESASEESTNE